MPLPIPNLDDRSFDELSAEARERLLRQLPDLAQISEGDPAFVISDLFAWMTETILYRANLIPERMRLAFLNLLQLPLRPVQPARSLLCVDGPNSARLPPLLPTESGFKAGKLTFTSLGELQPTPLQLDVVIKERLDDSKLLQLGLSKAALRQQYGERNIAPFRPRHLPIGTTPLALGESLDHAFYLLLSLPKRLRNERDKLADNLGGIILNIGLAPTEEQPASPFPTHELEQLQPRRINWELAWEDPASGKLYYLPLELLEDSSLGGRQAGVARIRLPADGDKLQALIAADYQFAGKGHYPPEAPSHIDTAQQLCWLRLHCPDEPELQLGYLGINCVEVVGQAVERDIMLGVGDGNPEQSLQLPHPNIDPFSLEIEVEESGGFVAWQRLNHLATANAESRVYTLDPINGILRFGDGIRGKRPLPGRAIRAAYYRHGGGSEANLPAGAITQLLRGGNGLKLRHEWPARGGVDAETVSEAEQRLPAFLSHRNRAVTRADFKRLAESNPINPVARAECVPGLLPGSSIERIQHNVPGVISLFVLPPKPPALNQAPRPSRGLLRDLFDYLSARILLGTELYLLSPEFVPVAISVKVQAQDPKTQRSVELAVEQALLAYLWALSPGGPNGSGWPLGRALDADEIRTRLSRTDGLLSASELTLFRYDSERQQWQPLARGELTLRDYQLPMLSAVEASSHASTADANTLPLPTGLAPADESSDSGRLQPIPVVPDLC